MSIEEIFNLGEEALIIEQLKKRATPLPSYDKLIADWEPDKHDVMDKEKRPDNVRIKKDKWTDSKGVEHPAETEPDPVNRIPLPLEQDIVNIHTAFTVGTEPKLNCAPSNDEEKELFTVIQTIGKKNKLKYHNKRVVRSWLSEKEVAEYWYVVKDDSFWKKTLAKIKNAIGLKAKAQYKLKVAIWSPFRGDKLYPLKDEFGDLIAFSREYKVKVDSTTEITYFMAVTDTKVYKWKLDADWQRIDEFSHGFSKIPVIFTDRKETLCQKIKKIRERIETLLSNYADCIDYNFFPRLVMEGEVIGNPTKENGQMIKIDSDGTGGQKVYYLTWNQTPESVKLELENLMEKAYSLTNTPRISFENLKGTGSALSGVSFRYVFMGMHMAVENHAESLGEYLQRRYNFLISAVGSLNSQYLKASETLDIEPEIVPYMIDDMDSKIKSALDATGQPIASLRTGVVLAGIVDESVVDEEVKKIEEEQKNKTQESAFPMAEVA